MGTIRNGLDVTAAGLGYLARGAMLIGRAIQVAWGPMLSVLCYTLLILFGYYLNEKPQIAYACGVSGVALWLDIVIGQILTGRK
jgi:hypothetical protein